MNRISCAVGAALFAIAFDTQAFFFIVPIPNLAKPPQLQSLIDALEKSSDTKAVAYVSEDKLFARKVWVWGHFAGQATQEDANDRALRTCEASLARAKGQTAGGQPLYSFGDKRCELYEFVNKTVNAPAAPIASRPAPGTQMPASVLPAPSAPSESAMPAAAVVPAPPPASVSAVPAAPAPLPTTAPAPAASQTSTGALPIESRLKQLQGLFDQKLITREEYERKRKELLDAL